MVCWRVSTSVHVIDPATLRTGEISAEKFWKARASGASAAASSKAPPPFKAILSKTALREYVVMDVEPIVDLKSMDAPQKQKGARRRFKRKSRRRRNFNVTPSTAGDDDGDEEMAEGAKGTVNRKRKHGAASGQGYDGAKTSRAAGGKFQLALVTVARSSDLESGDPTVSSRRITVRSHLGRILRIGDTVLGYDLKSANLDADALKPIRERGIKFEERIPDVVLVKKLYVKKRRGRRKGHENGGHETFENEAEQRDEGEPAGGLQRHWMLHSLPMSAASGSQSKGKRRGGKRGKKGKKGDDENAVGPSTANAGSGDVLLKGGLREVVGEEEYELFLRELEDDKELRSRIYMYKDRRAFKETVDALRMDQDDEEEEDGDGKDDEDAATVGLEELLDDLTLSGADDGKVNDISIVAAAAAATATASQSFEQADLDEL